MTSPTRYRPNAIGPANRLVSVSRPFGGTISLSYGRQGNLVGTRTLTGAAATQLGATQRVDMPHNQWALTSVVVDDGFVSSEIGGETGHSITTTFEYFNSGNYDRVEREDYGYGQIRTTRADNTYVDSFFYNQDYARHGMLARTESRYRQGSTPLPSDPLLTAATHAYITYEPQPATGTTPAATFTALTHTTNDTCDLWSGACVQTGESRTWVPRSTGSREYVLQTIVDEGDTSTSTPYDEITYRLNYDPSLPCLRVTKVTAEGASSAEHAAPLRERRESYWSTCAPQTVSDVERFSDGSERLLTTSLTFDSYGNLASATDPSGYQSTYTVDPAMHQFVVTNHDSFGYESSQKWDHARGFRTEITDINGQVQSFALDSFGRLKSIVGPARTPTVQYRYSLGDTNRFPAYAVTTHRALPTDTTSIETATFVDGLIRVIQTRRDATLDDGSGHPIPSTTVSGHTRWDDLGRVAEQGQPSRSDTAIDAFVPGLGLDHSTVFEYDPYDRQAQVDFPDGTSAKTTYTVASGDGDDRATRLLAVDAADALGHHRVTYHDPVGHAVRVQEFDDSGTPIDTRYRYDALGHLWEVIDVDGHVTSTEYDSLGRRSSITNPDSGETDYQYDAAGNLSDRSTANILERGATPIHYTYQYGRLSRIDYPAVPDYPSSPDFDPNTPVSVQYIYGAPRTAGAPPTTSAGRVTFRIDGSGITGYEYDELGQVTRTSQTLTNPDDPANPYAPVVTRFQHDRFGRMRQVTYPNGEVLTYGYDDGGALTHVSSTLHEYVTEILYDEFGQRTQIRYANGVTSHYGYDDNMRRLTSLNTASASGTFQDITYTYLDNGNISDIVNEDTVAVGIGEHATVHQHFDYDSRDQLTHASGNYSYAVSGGTMQHLYDSSFVYDSLGRMTSNAQQTAQGLGATLTGGGAVTRSLGYTYDKPHPHAPIEIDDGGTYSDTRSYDWDAAGNQTHVNIGGGASRTMRWDDENRLWELDDYDGSSTTVAELTGWSLKTAS